LGSKLLKIRTDLSDYNAPQYGYDRRGAGPRKTNASGQPYVIKDLPQRKFSTADFDAGVGPQPFDDFLLRGGQLLPQTTVKDLDRLGKMFTDLKSPNGLLFAAKQNVLSRTGINVLAGPKDSTNPKIDNKKAQNNGIYLPTSTLAQAGVNGIGFHLLKQGLNPFAATDGTSQDPAGNPVYFNTAAFSERIGNNATPQSRLVTFAKNQIDSNTNSDNILYSYTGGPGSDLGVGNTIVTMVQDQRTGRNNAELNNVGFYDSFNSGYFNYSNFRNPRTNNFNGARYFNGSGVSNKYKNLSGTNILNGQFKTTNDVVSGAFISNLGLSVFQSGSYQANSPAVGGLGTTLNYDQLMDSLPNPANTVTDNNVYSDPEIQDFRQLRTDNKGASSLDYTDNNLRFEGRVNLGNPGKFFDRKNYVLGRGTSLDEINSSPIYKASQAKTDPKLNDFCKFRIGVINNDNPSEKNYIHFRAILDGMNDNYTAEWESQKYAGRGENFYNYAGFDRNFSLGWTVVAQSKQELMPMYQKLNYLASVCAPDYSRAGYMRGNLIELTVGGYLYNQIGIMTGISYEVPQESPWEIGISNSNSSISGRSFSDQSVKEVPHMIKVSGFNFIPIQSFVPQIQKNDYNKEGELTTFGAQRYISLSNGITQNYLPDGKEEKIKQLTDSLN